MGDKVFFLSDFHLGSRRFRDARAAERRVVAFLDSIKEEAAEIYLLGDVLDYWYEYRDVVPKGFVRLFGKIAELADSGVRIVWMKGNHDMWSYGYLSSELGIEVADDPMVREIKGKRFFLAHGDGLGPTPRLEKMMLAIFRSRICRRLFSGIHPRWTVPFAYGWSSKNRGQHPVPAPYNGKENEPLMIFARQHLASSEIPVDYYVFGHRHIAVKDSVEADGKKAETVILGEWFDACSYAVFDGESLELRNFRQP